MAGITKIFYGITLFLIVYAIGFDFPISGDTVFGTWLIFYFIFMFYVINNKTTVVKNPKTGAYEEITIKKSIAEQEAELRYLEEEARAQEKLRQKQLNPKKQVEIQKEESSSPESIKDDISKYDLGDSLKRLKKMYSDGHLTKVEFEKAKNKLLK